VFVVHSEDRLAFEHAQREKAMGRVRAQLAALGGQPELGRDEEMVRTCRTRR
jgi:hypothetical protein